MKEVIITIVFDNLSEALKELNSYCTAMKEVHGLLLMFAVLSLVEDTKFFSLEMSFKAG